MSGERKKLHQLFFPIFFEILCTILVGAYAAMALDECVRAVFLYLRWRKGCWRTRGLTVRR